LHEPKGNLVSKPSSPVARSRPRAEPRPPLLACVRIALTLAIACAGPAAAVVEPPDPPPSFPPQTGGAWGPVIEWPHIPIAMAHLPDGRILSFASNEPNSWPYTPGDEYTHASVWDPATGAQKLVPHPSHDMFCAATVTVEDGETFVMGGRYAAGSPWVSYFDFQADRWIQFASDADMNRGRWYPTALYLGSGEIFIAVGTGGGEYPELWTPGSEWKLLTGVDLTTPILSYGLGDGSEHWPLMLLDPDGTVFHHGATPRMSRIDPFGGVAGLGTLTDLGPHGLDWYPDDGVSVLYDEGKILVAGGSIQRTSIASSANASRIDLMGPAPVITPTGSMHFPRQHLNEVLLPTGEVLVVGGSTTSAFFSDAHAIRNAEIWDPETGEWTLLNAQDQARTYHSTAALLLDGRVLSGGGGLSPVGQTCDGQGAPGECGIDHLNAEIFTPPYLFAADGTPAIRPTIASAPRVARVGRTIRVQATPGLSGFSLIRMSAATHTMNTDQRFLRPATTEVAPGVYDLTLHANENVIVPGFWMLFAMAGDVPSVARVVHVVNDGTPRGPRIDGLAGEVGDVVLHQLELEDPDGHPLAFAASGLPPGLTLSPLTGSIQGQLTTPGLYHVSLVASDGTDAATLEFQWIVATQRSELGRLDPTSTEWTTVELENSYESPVVVLGPPSFADPDPAIVRVRNVTSTSFEYRVAEWPYQDGAHAAESVAYLVVEAGGYRLANGATLLAGRKSGVDYENPQSVRFPDDAFAAVPTVLAQVASASEVPPAPTTTARIDAVSTGGFEVALRTQQLAGPSFPAEEVHWIAVEPGGIPGLLETAVSTVPLDETPLAVDFGAAFPTEPLIFATLQTTLDDDPVSLRHQNASTAGFEILAQEEASADAELDHAPEVFGWLALDPSAETLALLPRWNEPPTLVSPLDQRGRRGVQTSLALEALDPEGGPLVFSATGLPPGLELESTTGVIAGVPLSAGAFATHVTVADESGAVDSVEFLFAIEEALTLLPFPAPPAVDGSEVEFVATPSLPGGFEYQWDFGDGSPPSGVQTTPEISHVFTGPGHHVVTLTLSDPATGETDLLQFTQVVVGTPTPRSPTASGTILHEATRDRVWVVAPDNDSVAVLDTVTRTRIAEIPVAAGPATLAQAGDGRIWVASKRAAAIEILDPVALAVVLTIPLAAGSAPHGVVFDPLGQIAFVALEGTGEILRFDGATGAPIDGRFVGGSVRHLSVSADGATLYAPRFVTAPLPNEDAGQPVTEWNGEPVGGEVLRLDTATLASLDTTILPVSESADSGQSARGVPNFLGATAISPDGSRALVPSKQDNVYRGAFRDGLPLGHDTTIRAISSRIDLAAGTAPTLDRLDHDNAGLAVAATWVGLGAYVLTALEGNRQLAISDPDAQVELGRVDTGRAPRGIAISPDGRTAFVDNYMDRSVSVYDLAPLLDFGDAALTPIGTIEDVSTESLDPTTLRGKRHFFDAADPRLALERYVYCGGCHNEGGGDGRVWDFGDSGEGLRNTIDLRGHGLGQGRLHWTANFDEVQDFEGRIRHFGGGGWLTEAEFLATQDPLGPPKAGLNAELDALAAYVASLTTTQTSPARAADGALTSDAQAGRALFQDRGCVACHRGPAFTDSAFGLLHDVGTARPTSGPQVAFDTPTLRGLWRTAPYLHDGRAPSLAEAISAHVDTPLEPGELDALVAYLGQIDDLEVAAPNHAPVVLPTSPPDGLAVLAGAAVPLDATASDAEDGDLTSRIEWRSDADGTLGSGGQLTLTTLSAGAHRLTASVADLDGLSGETSVQISILGTNPPTVVLESPADESIFVVGAEVELRASASDPEDGDLGDAIVWTSSLDGPLGVGRSVLRSDLSLGSHVISAAVVDSLGFPDSAVLTLMIVDDLPPTLTITSPASGTSTLVGSPVSLIATAADEEDGDLAASVEWSSSLDGALGTGSPLVLSTLSEGLHAITASVVDSHGGLATDATELEVPEPRVVVGLAAGFAWVAGLASARRTGRKRRERRA